MATDKPMSGNEMLQRYETNDTINIPREVFEKIYLNPQTPVKGELRKTFGNPTPLALMGFLIATTPLGFQLLEIRGSGGGGAAIIGVMYFFGGMLQIIGAVMEWLIGNTFPMVVFGAFGAFWLSLGATLQPTYNAVKAYTATATTDAEVLAGEAMFFASFAFFLLFLGMLTTLFMIVALRTNIVFVCIFLILTAALETLAASYWENAEGNADLALKLQKAAGGLVIAFCMLGWYLLFAQLLQAVDFPLEIPVGDLSTVFKGASTRRREKGYENGV